MTTLTWAMLMAIVGLCLGLYGHTLKFPFQFDDQVYLEQNPLIRESGNFLLIFDIPRVYRIIRDAGLPADLATNFILRPVTYLTFALNNALGGMDPRGFRLVNIVIHGANAFLLFQVLRTFFRLSPKAAGTPVSSGLIVPAAASLLFLVHPLQVESVTYIVQRFAALGTLFYLLTVWLYFKADVAVSERRRKLCRAGSLLALVAGMFSKEEVFTAPLMLVLLDVLVMGTSWKRSLRRALPHLLCMAILPSLLMVIATFRNGESVTLLDALSVACPDGKSYQHWYALTEIRVVVAYLGLLLVPNRLNVDWDFPWSTSVGDWRVLGSAGIILVVIAWAWLFYRRKSGDVRHALLFVFVLWYFVTLAVSSSFVPLPDVMAEHRVYLASLGVMIAVVCFTDLMRTHFFKMACLARMMPIGVAVWTGTLGLATLQRNEAWRSCISLWADAAAKSPDKCRPWGNLGVAYLQERKVGEAVACLARSIELRPDYADGYRNLAGALVLMRKYPEAVRVSLEGQRICGSKPGISYNMAQALWEMGRPQDAIRALRQTLALSPKNFLAHLRLAQFYAGQDDMTSAKAQYGMAEALYPKDSRLPGTLKEIQTKERSEIRAN